MTARRRRLFLWTVCTLSGFYWTATFFKDTLLCNAKLNLPSHPQVKGLLPSNKALSLASFAGHVNLWQDQVQYAVTQAARMSR